MISQAWSVALASIGLVMLWLAGDDRPAVRQAAWVVGLSYQVLWLVYALASQQWAFAVSAVAYAVVHARNLRRGRRRSEPAEGTR